MPSLSAYYLCGLSMSSIFMQSLTPIGGSFFSQDLLVWQPHLCNFPWPALQLLQSVSLLWAAFIWASLYLTVMPQHHGLNVALIGDICTVLQHSLHVLEQETSL